MGLDMYLEARQSLYVSEYFGKEFTPAVNKALEALKEAIVPLPDSYNEQSGVSFSRKVISLEEIIGYWGKEPNLHGFIVENFADGNDDCQEIRLGVSDLEAIKEAVIDNDLPTTSGFFFGRSASPTSEDPDERERHEQFVKNTVQILDNAIEFLGSDPSEVDRGICYRASW